jgi:hypothetical protein
MLRVLIPFALGAAAATYLMKKKSEAICCLEDAEERLRQATLKGLDKLEKASDKLHDAADKAIAKGKEQVEKK